MYTLYGGGFTRAHITEMVFAEIGQPYKLVEVDTTQGAHHAPDYLKINPAGWVPSLITPEGEVLYETQAINLYLIDRHDAGGLAPTWDQAARGLFLSGLFYLTGELEPALKRYFYPHRYAPRPSDTAIIRQQSLDEIRTILGIINQRLMAHGPFHLGPRFSLVDLVLSYWIMSLMEDNTAIGFDAIQRCLAQVTARPKLKPLFEALEERTEAYKVIDRQSPAQS
jgi:glutathione S-transferase